jgi:hypothetical protein
MSYMCVICGGGISPARGRLGFQLCLSCGEEEARRVRANWCVVPLHKSNYILVTDPKEIPGMCSKTNYTHGKDKA